MASPRKTDAKTTCPNCGGVMSIITIEPIPHKPDHMRHVFRCASCGEVAEFEFLKGPPGG